MTTVTPQTPEIVTPAARVSSRAEMDAAIGVLQEKKGAWTEVGPQERLALLGELSRCFDAVADRWAALGIEAEGLDPEHPGSGEEALVGPYFILRNLRLLREALLDVDTHGRPRIPGAVRTRPDGQVVARIFPNDLYDRIFYAGVTADVWMEPGVTEHGPARDSGRGLSRARAAGESHPGPGRGQRLLHRSHGRPLQALRGGSGGAAQGPPGERLPGAGAGGGLQAARRPRLPARRLWRRRGGGLPHPPCRRGRDPHHGLGQDLRGHRLRPRRGGPAPQGRGRAAAQQALHVGARQRQRRHRGSRPVEREGPRLSRPEPGDHAHQQRRLQLQCRPGDRATRRLAAAPGPAQEDPRGARPGAGAQGLLPRRHGSLRVLPRRP